MNIITKEIRLLKRYIRLSFQNYIQFPIDFAMNFIMIFFDIAMIILFWYSIMNLGIVIEHWSTVDLYIFIALHILSEAISKTMFGFRDLEYFILDGSFDKFLIRPVHAIKSLLLEKLNIFAIISKTIIAITFLCIVCFRFNIKLNHIPYAVLILILGTISFELLYGSFSLLAFWFGKIYTAREIVFSFQMAKDYPLDIFPKIVTNLLTYLVPLTLIATVPTKILLNKEPDYIKYLILATLAFLVSIFLFNHIFKKALNRYNSTGS